VPHKYYISNLELSLFGVIPPSLFYVAVSVLLYSYIAFVYCMQCMFLFRSVLPPGVL